MTACNHDRMTPRHMIQQLDRMTSQQHDSMTYEARHMTAKTVTVMETFLVPSYQSEKTSLAKSLDGRQRPAMK